MAIDYATAANMQLTAANPFVSAGGMNFNDPQGSYNRAYGAAAQTNTNLYNNWMGMFGQLQAQQRAQQAQLGSAYGRLQRNVMRRLQGSNRANLQDISDKYTAAEGAMLQRMISSGLGNTSQLANLSRGLLSDRTQETTRSNNQFAQLMAGTASQLGQARLQAQERGIGTMLGLGSQGLNFLASINAPYPDAGLYASMRGSNISPAELPGMPGPHPGYRPIGGGGPLGGAFHGSGAAGMVDQGYGGGGDFFLGGYNPPPVQSTYQQAYGDGGGGIIAALASAGAGAFDTYNYSMAGGGGDF